METVPVRAPRSDPFRPRPYSYEGHWVIAHVHKAGREFVAAFFGISQEQIQAVLDDTEAAYEGEEWHTDPEYLARRLEDFMVAHPEYKVWWCHGIPHRNRLTSRLKFLNEVQAPYDRYFWLR